VLDDFGAFPAVIDREARALPAVPVHDQGADGGGAGGRRPETAHEAIKEHAVAVALAMREEVGAENDLLERLAADPRLGLSIEDLRALVAEPLSFTGAAASQVRAVCDRVAVITAAFPDCRLPTGDIL
jgi:adenylosuccinate lyase